MKKIAVIILMALSVLGSEISKPSEVKADGADNWKIVTEHCKNGNFKGVYNANDRDLITFKQLSIERVAGLNVISDGYDIKIPAHWTAGIHSVGGED